MSVRGLVGGVALSVPFFAASLAAGGLAPAETVEVTEGVVIIESHNRKSIIVLPGVGFGRAVEHAAERLDDSPSSVAGAADSSIKLVSEPSPPETKQH